MADFARGANRSSRRWISELRIKRFTPQVSDLFNITPRDHGRLIGNFTHSLDYRSLLDDLRSILQEGGKVIERQVVADDGQTFIARISPYLTTVEATGGVVLTFFDVSKLKQAENELRDREEQFRALIDASA